jgi:outer membrane protein
MRLKLRTAVLAGVCGLALAGAAQAETLVEAMAMAYQTNPQLLARRADLRALDETYVQARAGFRPSVDLGAQANLLDLNYARPSPSSLGRSGDDVTRGAETFSLSATASQPIYTGGRTSTTLREIEANILAGREQLRTLENDLFRTVIQAYVDVRRDQESVAIRQANVDVLRRQLEEVRARFEVGEITRTDVAQSEARLAASQSILSQQQAQLATSRAVYATLVGQSPGTLEPEPPLAALPASVDRAYEVAQVNNPELLAAELVEQASRARVAREQAERRPSVRANTSASYGRELDFNPLDRYGAELSANATLSLPFYRGGAVTSRIRAARHSNNADRIAIENTRRTVVQQVAQAWNSLQANRAALLSNEEQVRAARIAFEGVQAEAQAGLRTTLDVLNAQAELRNAELALVNARRDSYVAGASVLDAMGVLEARNLLPGEPIYDPAANFNSIRRSHFWIFEPLVEGLDQIGAPQVEARPTSPAPTIAGKPAPAKAAETKAEAVKTSAAGPDPEAAVVTASLDAVVDASLARP